MNRLGQMLMDEGMEKGIEKGIEQGIEKGIEKGIELNQTDSIKKLMKNMSWTIDQAMNALEIPEDKREKYRQTIVTNN